jgi:RNA methyltransferase, TrmH family
LKLLTLARDLRRRKAREKLHLFVAEGVRAVEELVASSVKVRGTLIAPQLRDAPRGEALITMLRSKGVETNEVTAAEFASAAETESPQGVIAIGEIPPHGFDSIASDWKGTILILDAVQDPGNVGTILRTAAALGVTATIAMPGTVDLWNAKVVRSGMGAHFKHLMFSGTWSDLDSFRRRTDFEFLAADASGTDVSNVTPGSRVALVVGNEGSGLSTQARSRAARIVSLPIQPNTESLNVAVATGILLYALAR